MSESSALVLHEKGVAFMLSRIWPGSAKKLFCIFQLAPLSKH